MRKIFLIFLTAFVIILPVRAWMATTVSAPPMTAKNAVSLYVQAILDRADQGINDAKRYGSITSSDSSSFLLLRQGLAILLRPADTRFAINLKQQELAGATACFHYDLFLILQKMNDVKAAIDEATNAKQPLTIWQLSSVADFLRGRFEALRTGGLDPSATDENFWQIKLLKEEPKDRLPMCAFATDYTPPAQSGFGCDKKTLESIVQSKIPTGLAYDQIRKELDEELKTEMFIEDSLAKQQKAIYDFSALQTVQMGPAKRQHKTLEGCVPQHVCAGDGKTACVQNVDCKGKGDLCVDPLDFGLCENTETKCTTDAQCGGKKCVSKGPPALRELQGRFSLNKDEIRLLKDFTQLRQAQGATRGAAEQFDPPAPIDFAFFLFDIGKQFRDIHRDLSTAQGRQEAGIFAQSIDPEKSIDTAFSKLNQSVGLLSRIAQDRQSGLLAFVRDFAFFLRRSCMERPCTASLDRILKIVLAEDPQTHLNPCFPYTSGLFDLQTAGADKSYDPVAKCKEATER